jgi:hypothetical protein
MIRAQDKEQPISFSLHNATLKEIIAQIEKETGYSFVYNENIDLSQKKSVSDKALLNAVLPVVFQNTGINWKIKGKHIILQPETVALRKDTLHYNSPEQSIGLQEIVVDADRNKLFNALSGAIELTEKELFQTPTLMGEPDVMKTLQLLPGVQAGVQGTTGLYIHGGDPGQNLTLLDGVNIYNPNHFYGMFSIFNGDAVKKVSLYKSNFPARFGGRLSAVMDTRLKEGDRQHYHGDLSIGLISSHLNLEGPIIKDKTSFFVSGRYAHFNAFFQAWNLITDNNRDYSSYSYTNNSRDDYSYYFYDLNAKITHQFSDKSRLSFNFYSGKDKMGTQYEVADSYDYLAIYEKDLNYHWGNTIGSLRWNYLFKPNLSADITLAYNSYRFNFNTTQRIDPDIHSTLSQSEYKNDQRSGIKDWIAKIDMEFLPDDRHTVRFGAGTIFHTFQPEVFESTQFDVRPNNDLQENSTGTETSFYIEDEMTVSKHWKTNLGLHFSSFHTEGKNYGSLQPRIALEYEVNPKLSFRTSYSTMSQYMHLLTSSTLSQPTDLWVPVRSELPPMLSRQITLGGFYNTKKGYNFSIEGFYKKMNNLLEYKDGASWSSAEIPWYEQVESGKGRAQGIEFFAQKTTGKFTGWAGYTLAWNDRKFPTINNGIRFPAKYDRRHDLKIHIAYKQNEKWDFSATWNFASGNTISLPLEGYAALPKEALNTGDIDVTWSDWYNTSPIARYENRNNFRLPSTSHLDVSMNYYRKKNAKGRQSIWNLTVYNLLCQRYSLFTYVPQWYPYTIEQMSIFPILPSVSYTYKF